ncbi:MAG: hypothetical protein NC098_05125 [Lachnoclostridium sp.]|nr:hypothetical protein [Lachnoclostridium sp.]
MYNPLKAITSALRRQRTSRGFGVHSPFAFGFIVSVLTCKYPYYCFDNLEATARHLGEMKPKDALTLFRVIDQFVPSAIGIVGNESETVRQVVNAWCDRCHVITSYEPDFIIITDDGTLPADIGEKIIVMLSTRSSVWDGLKARMTRGMTFSNRRIGIAVNLTRLPRHDFILNF